MLQAFAAAFRTPDLRRKLLFSLAIIAVYRLGASVPGPGVSVQAINSCLELAQASGTDALLVLNRVPPRGRAAEQMRAEIAARRWPLAGALLGNRQAYAASIGEGRGVAESAPTSAAGQEIAALADEVLVRLA